jgi:hypothetical protein
MAEKHSRTFAKQFIRHRLATYEHRLEQGCQLNSDWNISNSLFFSVTNKPQPIFHLLQRMSTTVNDCDLTAYDVDLTTDIVDLTADVTADVVDTTANDVDTTAYDVDLTAYDVDLTNDGPAAPTAMEEEEEKPTCSICMCPFTWKITTSCGHSFCFRCIQQYASTRRSTLPCPLCRQPLCPLFL